MRFFKENSEGIIRLFINQIGIAIFSFFIYTAVGAISKDGATTETPVKVLISVFCLAFYFVLLYTATWEYGAKDKIRIDAGRAEKKTCRGLFMGLYANIPNFIITGVSFILFGAYMLGLGEGFKAAFAIFNAIFRIFISMYLGVIEGLTAYLEASVDTYYLVQTLYFMLLPLISVLVVHIAYVMGLHERRIIPRRQSNNKK